MKSQFQGGQKYKETTIESYAQTLTNERSLYRMKIDFRSNKKSKNVAIALHTNNGGQFSKRLCEYYRFGQLFPENSG